MRKLLVLLLVFTMIATVALAGCGKAPEEPATDDPASEAPSDSESEAPAPAEEIDFDNLVVPEDEAGREELRMKLAQQYKNAEPGESFLVGISRSSWSRNTP